MATRSQSKIASRASKASLHGSSSNLSSAKTDGKHKKKVTVDGEADEREGALAFKVLTADQTRELQALSIEHIQMKLCDIFKLDSHSTDLREASILDFYTASVWWGKEKAFSLQQLSGFFTLVHTLFNNVKEKHLSLVENLKEMKKMLVGIGAESGPDMQYGGLEFFDVNQAKEITNYLYTSFFQHYTLHEYMFSTLQAEEIIGTDLDVEVAKAADVPFPPPLDEGVSEEHFTQYIATPPPTPVPEPVEATADEVSELQMDDKTSENIFSELSVEDVKEVIESVAKEMLGGLQTEVAAKLREKENQLISKINKIHRVAET
ncbi:ciliary-associated calcium-binding coiled-coil protein 1-like [Haliotis cracherodii]|uniref:ciliary-associated calcium-binding coiled-coil protein 1-like n=1 Tax=Haliotis cracherodii TaxID=6455 RepID=UPI0039EA901B